MSGVEAQRMVSKILVVGSLNADLVLRVPRFPAPGETLAAESLTTFAGGKGANQAFGAAKLGASVRMLGQVGDDTNAEWLRAELATVGVDVSHVHSAPDTATGTALISVDASGQNQIVIVAGANGTFGPAQLAGQVSAFSEVSLVMLQLEIPLETVAAAIRFAGERGLLVVLDPAPARPLPEEILAGVDYLTPNESELCVLTGCAGGVALSLADAEARARQLLARGVKKLLVKLAERGALLVTPEGTRAFPAFAVRVVDTTAAGDAFNAGLGYALAAGYEESRAIEVAMAAGACAVTRRGAQASMPTWSDVQARLSRQDPGAAANGVR